MSVRQNTLKLIAGLSWQERELLLSGLLAERGLSLDFSGPGPADLARAERSLAKAAEGARGPKALNSRLRLWFIFMLLRYGGLRLEEVFNLEGGALEPGFQRVHILSGKFPRTAPLPLQAARRMAEKLELWPALFAIRHPFRCDGSLVRRGLAQCASACGILPGLLSARALRRGRELELKRAGLPRSLINLFLGRRIAAADFNAEEGLLALERFIHNEAFPKTSARNAFYGRLSGLSGRGILVDAELETAAGLAVRAVITETSRQSLGLKEGMPCAALVKAPMAALCRPGEAGDDNYFEGVIMEIKRDDWAMEVIVRLPQGNVLCALYAQGKAPPFPIAAGDSAGVRFSPFSVILTGA